MMQKSFFLQVTVIFSKKLLYLFFRMSSYKSKRSNHEPNPLHERCYKCPDYKLSVRVMGGFACRYQLVHREGGKWRLQLHVSACTTSQQTLPQIHLCVSGGTGAGSWRLPLQTRSVRRVWHLIMRSHACSAHSPSTASEVLCMKRRLLDPLS